MSSIIDALRKSDQNRSQNNPSGNQINFSENSTKKTSRGFIPLTLVLLLVAVAVYGWQQGWHHQLMAKSQTEKKPGPQASTAAAEPKTLDQAPKKEVNNTPKLSPPKPQEVIEKQQTKSVTQTNPSEAKSAEPKSAEPKSAETNVNESKAPPTDTPEPVSEPRRGGDLTMPAPEEVEPPVETEPKATEKTQTNKSLEPTFKQDHLLIHQLDFSIRKDIPPLRINIHIFDPKPENRLVIINGERFGIGDVIEEFVTVKDITKDGVVLGFENVTFLLPK